MQYPYPPPPPRRGMPVWAILLLALGGCGCLGMVAVLAAIILPVFAQARNAARRASCTSNVKQLAVGLLMYTEDHDERLPPKTVWNDDLYPYIKNPSVNVCPARASVPYGYAFNSLLDRKKLADVSYPALAPTLFESTLGIQNGADPLQSFVAPHYGLSNLAFLDGHVKSVQTPPSARAGINGVR